MKRWPTKTLGQVCDLVNGRAFKPDEWEQTGIPIIRIQNLNDPTKPFNYTTKELPEKFKVRRGDTLLSWSGTPGTSFGCFRWQGVDGWLNQHIFSVRFNDEVIPSFFIYQINSKLKELIARAHGGVGLQHITKGALSSVDIVVPPLHEQERVVMLLDEADALRRLRAQADRRMKDVIPALFHEMFGDLSLGHSAWQLFPVSEIAEVQGGLQLTAKRNDLTLHRPYLRVANVQRGFLILDEMKEIGLTETEFLRTRLQAGDLLLVEGNGNPDEIGRAAMWRDELSGVVHQNHLIRVRPNPQFLDSSFLLTFINGSEGRAYFRGTGNTTSGLVTISTSKVKDCRIPVPPLPLQREFAKRMEEIRAMEAEQAASRQRLDDLFQSMLHRAFNGEL